MKNILLILISLFLVSCQSADKKRKESITRLVTEWQGKEITFPQNPVFTVYATDTVDYQIPDAEFKVLVYVDSIGCTSCKLQLPKWKELIAEVDSLTHGKVPFLFFLHPKDVSEIRSLLKRGGLYIPVCIDLQDKLNRKNRFPSDMTFQTFLLNKGNKVVVIGNPIHNLTVRELYLKQMGAIDAQSAEKSNKTTAMAEVSEIDMGVIEKSETKQAVFTLRNTGDNPLVTIGTTVSCGCVTTSFDKQPAKPGEALTVTVNMTPKESGSFYETIHVKCNTEQQIRLTIKGQAR